MMKPLWIDTDMGFDDLAAIALCLDCGAKIAGVSLVAGNTALPQVIYNARACAETFGWAMPIHAGAAHPFGAKAAAETAINILGTSGMRSTGLQLPAPSSLDMPMDGIEQLANYLRAGNHDVLALGPLTNIAHLVQTYPDLAKTMNLVWMGGAFARGNHTPVAEFNAAADPEAIACVLDAGIDMVMVGLECCREVSVQLDDAATLRQMTGPTAQLVGDLFEGYVRIAANGTRPMPLFDPVAAAIMMDPGLTHLVPVHIAAECAGTYTRGMTVIEWRNDKIPPNARVAVSPDADTIRRFTLDALASLTRS